MEIIALWYLQQREKCLRWNPFSEHSAITEKSKALQEGLIILLYAIISEYLTLTTGIQ